MNEKLTRPAFVVAVALVVLPAVAAAQSSGGTHEWTLLLVPTLAALITIGAALIAIGSWKRGVETSQLGHQAGNLADQDALNTLAARFDAGDEARQAIQDRLGNLADQATLNALAARVAAGDEARQDIQNRLAAIARGAGGN